ncbi:MAG: glycosyltransferase family 9 protein [Candidatus Omnitrophica bacterium]|nr:glycosyltransferase family 9 protein [Candidatus Omnitrophota bacterium]
MKRILFINPFGIGDCLFTTPLISAIKEHWPDSFIGYWCNQRVSDILKSNPKIDVVFPLSRGDIKRIYSYSFFAKIKNTLFLRSKIRRTRFDVSLDFSLDHRYGMLAKLCGIKRRIGIDYRKRGKFLTQKLEISGYHDKHIVEYYLQLLDFFKIEPLAPKLELFVDGASRNWAKKFLIKHDLDSSQDFIGVCPGAGESWGKDASFKRWDAKNFASVCNKIITNSALKILIFGNKQDEQVCEAVYNSINEKANVHKLYPSLSLNQFSALLERCKFILTNDGGPLHMAVALGVRSVSVFGPVNEVVYGPYPQSKEHIVMKSDLSCRPCYKNFRISKCENNNKCLVDISPEEVFSKVRRFL